MQLHNFIKRMFWLIVSLLHPVLTGKFISGMPVSWPQCLKKKEGYEDRLKVCRVKVCLFELSFYVLVNIYSHAGTLPPFYGTFTQH